MTENELLKKRPTPDSVGMGSYTIDSHNVQRYITPEGYVQNEGDIGVPTQGPYEIAYGALVPKPGQCDNLLVPVCVSSSHIAFGSIRMEPVFMILGQSAATAACLAIDAKIAVQKVDYPELRARLLADGQILDWTGPARTSRKAAATPPPLNLKGIVLDDADGVKTGPWHNGTVASSARVSWGYLHDANTNKGQLSITWTPDLPEAAEYEIILIAPPNRNRATNIPVTIAIQGGQTNTIQVNQRASTNDGFASLGKFSLPKGKLTAVTVSNQGTDGHVVADGVQFLPATGTDPRGRTQP